MILVVRVFVRVFSLELFLFLVVLFAESVLSSVISPFVIETIVTELVVASVDITFVTELVVFEVLTTESVMIIVDYVSALI